MTIKTDHIPIDQWSIDHWSTLLYIESRIVDHKGYVDHRQLRAHPKIHPQFAHQKDAPGTRIHPNKIVHPHDDWSCIEDMIAEGLVEWGGTGTDPQFSLTDRGHRAAASLRKHRSRGGQYKDFQYRRAAQHTRSISVRGETYRRFRELCKREGVSMKSKLEQLIEADLKRKDGDTPPAVLFL